MWRIAPVAAIWLTFTFCQAAGGDMQSPRITRAEVDWEAAANALDAMAPLKSLHASAEAPTQSSAVNRLNAATARRFPGIEQSPVPVLLPFDTEAYLRDRAAGAADDPAYFFGFNPTPFFHPGPSGYDAAFRVQSIPEFADIRYVDASDITITGSVLTYELDPPVSDAGVPVPELEGDFPGIHRLMLEGYVRYTFVRFGAPYVVAVPCFDGPSARFRHMACRDADRVIAHFLKSLRVAGGMPHHPSEPTAPRTIERPADVSPTFSYRGPGRLIPRTGLRGAGGRIDYTVYADIRFPIAQAPAFANSQYFKSRLGGVTAYPWNDNFCERRSYFVGQCPGGLGHQGQDIRAAECNPQSEGEDRCTPHQHEVVAVRAGAIMRAPRQEAVYLLVNTPSDHIRFRYLHMHPKLLDVEGILSGRRVEAGEVIGQIGNYSQRENGTSYHLHFDIQVPTRAGWVFVNPYMTLVAAYERLIGGRGEEIREEASIPPALSDAAPARMSLTLAAIRQAILAPAERQARPPQTRRHPRPRVAAASQCGAKLARKRHWTKCEVAEARVTRKARAAEEARSSKHAHGPRPARATKHTVVPRKPGRHHRA